MICAPVRSIIHSLKLVDYLSFQVHQPCSISLKNLLQKDGIDALIGQGHIKYLVNIIFIVLVCILCKQYLSCSDSMFCAALLLDA